ncbi:isatin hydrolase-like [Palaemon carinicauda]|uniref:isatin hydrolase-like n=1 Tax=Palaemon carinicauda TaxID=392227 RepID=UPI0035B5B777
MNLALLLLPVLGIATATAELIELSYTYNVDAPTSATLSPFVHKQIKKGFNELGIWVELNDFCSSEHSGTHVDAPVHFAEHGWSLDAIPTRRLWRVPAVVIDVSKHIKVNQPNYEVKIKDFEDWENTYGTIPDGSLVLIRTGWGAKVREIRQYLGMDANNNQNYPGIGKGAAEWLTRHGKRHGYSMGVIGVGIDTASVDVGKSVRYPSHVALYKENIYGIENMANLDKLPAKGAFVTVLPMRIGKGSGGPARVIAEVGEASGAPGIFPSTLMLVVMVAVALIKGIVVI